MTGLLRTGALRQEGARIEIRGARDANRAIRAGYACSSFVLEALKRKNLPAGDKQTGY
jgi:hypothetical protein